MRGHIRKRGTNCWAIVLELGRDPATGRRCQKWHSVKGTKRDAERELARLLNELNIGTYVGPTRMTIAEYTERWLADYAKPNTAPRTYEGYATNLRKHVVGSLGALQLNVLRPTHIQDLYAKLLRQGLSSKTVHYVHTTLHEALKHAVRWDLIARNPCEVVEPPRVTRPEVQALTANEAIALLKALAGMRLYLPVLLALSTGMRRGEILGLTWSSVDLAAGMVYVRRAMVRTKDRAPVYAPPKTDRSRRGIAITPTVACALEERRALQACYRQLMGGYLDYDLVVCLEDGRAWSTSNFNHTFRRAMNKLGYPRLRFHDLRHTHATLLLCQGVHPKVVSERLGHSQIGITMDTYSHVMPIMQREAAARLDELLFPE